MKMSSIKTDINEIDFESRINEGNYTFIPSSIINYQDKEAPSPLEIKQYLQTCLFMHSVSIRLLKDVKKLMTEVPYEREQILTARPKKQEISSPVESWVRDKEISEKFNRLAEQWKEDTAIFSTFQEKAMNPAYQQIIGMGPSAVPFILKDLSDKPDHWFWALSAITGANPVKKEHRGKIEEMVQDWLDWARSEGYEF